MTLGALVNDRSAHTSAMAQYFCLKARHPEALVFFRMGEFDEVLHGDARKATGCSTSR
jgi:DNA mismatch repair protein MutS